MAIYLIIQDGEEENRVRLTQKPFFIGRSSKCHLTLQDSMISGKHLAVKINSEHRVVIKDLETTNGTYLNGNKIQESFMYIEDFVQVGKVKIHIDDSEMSAKELGLHKRDFERTSVTFVRLGAQVEGLDDIEEDEFGQSKQKTLLAKIRKKNDGEGTKTATSAELKEDNRGEDEEVVTKVDKKILPNEMEELEIGKDEKKKAGKKGKRKAPKVDETKADNSSLMGKLKGLFKK
ncbi:MAG: FHA domain-containing protein [Halobacteriovoraceae bacterium]|nr:FHA domain-containing protein [Halobacteriovoraceae bacterium]